MVSLNFFFFETGILDSTFIFLSSDIFTRFLLINSFLSILGMQTLLHSDKIEFYPFKNLSHNKL